MTGLNALAKSTAPSATMLAAATATDHPDPINMAVGEPAEPAPPFLVEAAKAALDQGETRYSQAAGIAELREALAQDQERNDGCPRPPQEVLVTAGAKPALMDALRVLLEPGDEVLIPAPFWPTFLDQALWAGGVPKVVPPGEDGIVSVSTLEQAAGDRTRVLILNSPVNPSGRVLGAELMGEIAAWATARGLWILADQAYLHLAFDPPAPTLLSAAPQAREKTVVVESFSKRFAMAGLRLGAALGPAPIIAAMESLVTASSTHPSTLSQHAGLAALRHGDAWVEEQRDIHRRRRDKVLETLDGIPGVEPGNPEAALYVFPEVEELLEMRGFPDDATFCAALLAEEGVRIVPGSAFGQSGYLRLSYGLEDSRLEEALTRLAGFAERSREVRPG